MGKSNTLCVDASAVMVGASFFWLFRSFSLHLQHVYKPNYCQYMNHRPFICLLLALFSALSMSAQGLCFHDGQFKIVQFTDLHYKLGDPASRAAVECIQEVVKAEQPDLIIVTGDIVYSKPGDFAMQAVLNVLSQQQTPYCLVLGNHDPEQGVSATALYDLMQKAPGCVMPPRRGKLLDYVLPVYAADGKTLRAQLYGFDTHGKSAMRGVGGYAWITQSQQAWYRRKCAEAKATNGGKTVPALAFMHYPLPEYNEAVANTQVVLYGTRMERAYAPKLNSGMFAAFKECGDVMGVFCGHDHDNDYSLMFYQVMLAHGRFSGGNTEYNHLSNGARVIVLKEGRREFDTWIRERSGRVLYETTYPTSYVKDDWKKRKQ